MKNKKRRRLSISPLSCVGDCQLYESGMPARCTCNDYITMAQGFAHGGPQDILLLSSARGEAHSTRRPSCDWVWRQSYRFSIKRGQASATIGHSFLRSRLADKTDGKRLAIVQDQGWTNSSVQPKDNYLMAIYLSGGPRLNEMR